MQTPTTTVMNTNQIQDQKPLPVQELENAHKHLAELRESFIQRFGIHPSAMYVGKEIYRRGFPAAHSFPVKCWAIEDMIVVQKDELDPFAVVIPKPPELRKQEVA